MSVKSITIVAGRELREMMGDWRIVLPVGLLAFVLPFLMANATMYVIDFVSDERLADALLPFAILLVGFIPASFSIVTALESFVGERERNTMEALLSMPLSDRYLYISKLSSSLLTPLLSSYASMLICSFLLYTFANRLYHLAITPERLALLFLLIGLMALTMVAGAVVISSHASTIRGANLMASFVLLPAALVVQVVSFQIISDRWHVLWLIVLLLAAASFVLIRSGMSSFNREDILSREHQYVQIPPLRRLQVLLGVDTTRAAASASGWSSSQQTQTPQVVQRLLSPLHNVRIVAHRELRETLTDGRILVPIFVLTFIIPLVITALMPYAVDFVNNTPQLGRIMPFAILLVGFIPASFSIVTALESFVGERERNSLEALLSMPVSDNELYSSKILASLVVPLLTSYIAMLFFAGLLIALYPELYFVRMSLLYLVQLLLMISMMSLVMVTGAVIISSHTSSIRAANLLVSFILIPVTVVTALQLPVFIANRWDMIWLLMGGLVVAAIALVRTGMDTFNREEILSREHEQLSLKRTLEVFALFFNEYQPAGVPVEAYRREPFSARRFYRRELPALIRELRLPILIALIAALSGALMGGYYGLHHQFRDLDGFLGRIGRAPSPSLGLTLYVFFNNLRVSLFSNLLSLFSFGIFAFLVPAVAFAQLGFVGGALYAHGGSPLTFLLAYVLPHGMIELPTFILSAAIGIRLGASILSPPGRFTVGQNMLWSLATFAKLWLLVLAPLVLAGALVEGFVTPLIVRLLY